jgi:hypothetical protein
MTAEERRTERDKSFERLLDGAEVADWVFRARRELFPRMRGLAISVVIGPDDPDAKIALEVGAAVLFDVPIVVVLPYGRAISEGLRSVAEVVVEVDFASNKGYAELSAAIGKILGEKGKQP